MAQDRWYYAATLEELQEAVAKMEKVAVDLRNMLARRADTVALVVAAAHVHPATTEVVRGPEASKAMRICSGVTDRLDEAGKLLGGLRSELAKAGSAVEEADARRKHRTAAGPQLGIR